MSYSLLENDDFNPGAVKDRPDARAITLERALGAGLVEDPVIDWEKGFDIESTLKEKAPVVSQGTSLSCVGQAWREYTQILETKEASALTRLSARDVYSQIHLPQGTAYIEAGAKLVTSKGIAELNDMTETASPSEAEMQNRNGATPQSVNKALRYKAKSYASTFVHADPIKHLENMAKAIVVGLGAVSGATGSNPGWREAGGVVRPPLSGETQWGHAICLVGYTMVKGKRAIKFKNSFGAAWGDAGYGYFTEDYFKNGEIFSAYTLIDLPDDWLEDVTSMLNIVKNPNGADLYVIGKDGKAYRIPDEPTWKLLKDMKIVPLDFVSPTPAEFATYQQGGDFPSKKLMDTLSPVARDIFGIVG